MIALKDIQNVYFIGIGGIGMSALARYFHEAGAKVSGYDRTPSALTKQLEGEGIDIHYLENVSLIDKNADVVIYTPAISKNNAELKYCIHKNYRVLKRSEALQLIVKGMFCIAVAGTHGKTTVSSCIAHILRESGYGCNAFLGGIAVNYETNYWSNKKPVAVIEADEYDRSFLRLQPDIAVLTSMDADHLDIYGTVDALQDAFIQYTQQIKPEGYLIYKQGLKRNEEMGGNKITYSLKNNSADIYADHITVSKGGYTFDIAAANWMLANAFIQIGGIHNVENAAAAVAVAHRLGISDHKIKTALSTFKGVKRRFEYIVKNSDHIFIDDYAHHPEELKTLISSAKELYPEKKCTIIFQPHLYSRTRDLSTGFADALDLADEVILLPVYPAREEPLPGVESNMIAQKMNIGKVHLFTKKETLSRIKKDKPELLIMAGAGDIAEMIEPVKNYLTGKS